jgi:hypothetical protein
MCLILLLLRVSAGVEWTCAAITSGDALGGAQRAVLSVAGASSR